MNSYKSSYVVSLALLVAVLSFLDYVVRVGGDLRWLSGVRVLVALCIWKTRMTVGFGGNWTRGEYIKLLRDAAFKEIGQKEGDDNEAEGSKVT